jgi:hypothetical protein
MATSCGPATIGRLRVTFEDPPAQDVIFVLDGTRASIEVDAVGMPADTAAKCLFQTNRVNSDN